MDKGNKKVLFIHIPKTAGTSINHVLNGFNVSSWEREWEYNYHEPYFLLQKNNSEINRHVFVFSIVRNPFTRTYSCFNHFNKVNELKISFSEFLDICLSRSNKFPIPDKEFPRTPMIFYALSLFLYGSDGRIKLNNIYKFEDLTPIKNKLSKILKNNIDFPRLNMGDRSHYYESYTTSNIDKVKDIYSIDFDNFKYSHVFS